MAKKIIIVLISVIGLYACDKMQIPDWPSSSSLTSLPFYIGEGPKKDYQNDCRNKAQISIINLNWKKVKIIEIFSKSSGIKPKKILMAVNTPYIIKLYNGTNDIWSFQGGNFFRNAAIEKIIYGGNDTTFSCIKLIRIGKMKWAELHLVPLRKGIFELKQEKKFNLTNIFFSKKATLSSQIIVGE
jgi:hypothetical protein